MRGGRARVTASCELDSRVAVINDGQMMSPAVTVEVSWEVGDHEYALSRLEEALFDVRRQIAEASA